MTVDARTLENNSIFYTDVCIVGAGAAGITVAKELKNSSLNVLLLESGGFEYDQTTQSLYEGDSTGISYFPLSSCRLRFFGGTTGHWAGFCAPLDPIDFEKRDWIPHSGWPITYQDMESWYRRAQEICQLGPFQYGADYWEKQRTEFERLPLDRKKVYNKIIQFSPPTRFGQEYREEITQADNINLWTYANVTNIHSTDSASHVTGIEVTPLNGKKVHVRAKKYVLACGGMENPRILLLSNKVVKQGLGNQNGLVGRYFMEHPHIISSHMILRDDISTEFYQPYKYKLRFVPLLGISSSLQKQHRSGNYSTILERREMNNLQMHKLGFSEDPMAVVKMVEGAKRDSKESAAPVEPPKYPTWAFNTRIEQVPNPDSRVMLSNKKDSLGQPRINFHWQLTELDKKTIRVAEQTIARELGKLQAGRVRLPDWVLAENNEWPDHLVGGWHHMGTTRMSDNPKQGVVDANCKVHGIDNLYIGGSSVFTTSGTANPTMTIVALAARLADHLKSNSNEA